MTDKTNPRAELDEALAAMRSMRYAAPTSEHITMRATVVCAEALALLVDAHLPHLLASEPEAEPEPEADPRESLPDDTPVGHGWVMGRIDQRLHKPDDNGRFTWWLHEAREWGAPGAWPESYLVGPRPATVGDLRRVGLPESEWPGITVPEPEQSVSRAVAERDSATAALRAVRDELAKLAVGYFAEGDDARSAYRESMQVVDGEARRRGLDLGVATA